MGDDKTQEMPVMADAGDMPTETLHAVDAQSTYDQSQHSGRATQDDKPRVESAPAQGVPTYTASAAGATSVAMGAAAPVHATVTSWSIGG